MQEERLLLFQLEIIVQVTSRWISAYFDRLLSVDWQFGVVGNW